MLRAPTPQENLDYRKGEGWQRAAETYAQIKQGKKPSGKKSLNEMNLEELLDAEQKYLAFVEKNPTHPDLETKKHIYDSYVVPRIQELKEAKELEGSVVDILMSPEPPVQRTWENWLSTLSVA